MVCEAGNTCEEAMGAGLAWGWDVANLDEVNASPVVDKLRHCTVVAPIQLLELH